MLISPHCDLIFTGTNRVNYDDCLAIHYQIKNENGYNVVKQVKALVLSSLFE